MVILKKLEVLPTSLFEFELPQEIYFELVKGINAIDWRKATCRGDNQSHGRSTEEYEDVMLQRKPTYANAVKHIKQKVNVVAKEVQYSNLEELEVSMMWANLSQPGQWHHRHMHPWSVLSGIIYISGTGGKTWFSRASDYKLPNQFTLHGDSNTVNSDLIYKHTPKPGTMLIFPSSLDHSVENNENNENRITISFNTFPNTRVGNVTHLSGVDLTVK